MATKNKQVENASKGESHQKERHDMHLFSDRFPTEEELRRHEAKSGAMYAIGAEEISLRLDRVLAQALLHQTPSDASNDVALLLSAPVGPTWRDLVLGPPLRDRIRAVISPWILALLRALQRPRIDHRLLDANARNQFNQAVQAAHNDGSYQTLAAVHADMSHRMHSTMGPVGTQRFLPWHRIYTLQMENLLRAKQPALTIPFWNYSNDAARPDWVWQPPGVTRGTPGANGGNLPSQATVDNLVNNVSAYTSFTQGVEFNAHNQIHNWCNGTISSPPNASRDPIFWLLHANVDRIWDLWQHIRTGTPTLSGSDATMDPWMQTATNANDIIQLGYVYQ